MQVSAAMENPNVMRADLLAMKQLAAQQQTWFAESPACRARSNPNEPRGQPMRTPFLLQTTFVASPTEKRQALSQV